MVAMFVLCNSFHPENYNVLRDPPYISCTNDAKKRLKVNWTTVPKHLRFQKLVFFIAVLSKTKTALSPRTANYSNFSFDLKAAFPHC